MWLTPTLQISSRNLDRVRKLKSAMTRLTARVQKVYVLCLVMSKTSGSVILNPFYLFMTI